MFLASNMDPHLKDCWSGQAVEQGHLHQIMSSSPSTSKFGTIFSNCCTQIKPIKSIFYYNQSSKQQQNPPLYSSNLLPYQSHQYSILRLKQKGRTCKSRGTPASRGYKIVILQMKKNINWFGSPIPKPTHFANSHLHPCVELDESPTPRQTRQPNSFIFHPQLQNASLYPETRINSPQPLTIKREKVDNNQIGEILVYSQEQEEAGLITPSQRHYKKQAVCTTGRKNQRQGEVVQKRTRPKDKGLKGVSARAFQLVKLCKETTYKEMANLLLKQFDPQGTSESRTEEINIRRRVYDALNVFQALGILRKDGRRLVNDNPKKRNMKRNENQYEVLYQKMLQKEQIVKQKRSKLAQVQTKLKNARELLMRNIKNKSEENLKNVTFPFIGIVGFADYQMDELSETSVTIRFNTMVFPFGDMDSLNYL